MSDGVGVVGGSPSDEEVAAVAAVLTEVGLERAASTLPLPEEEDVPSAWQRSARGLRAPLPRGAWNH
ncbi:acyl-CoA carboxylase subunit epsilon [Amnibacterium endophyticum]|uniref:Acyl-CoA carboxylase subunit epsilon n=1 Tax=Amnibacterium endophyticum TaxID=2109337 RepID=A0ABW4LD44_9MICO